MERARLHEMIDRLEDAALEDVGRFLELVLERGHVARYRAGQRVRLVSRDPVASGVEVGEEGVVQEADPVLYPPRVSVEFARPGVTADVDPRNIEPQDLSGSEGSAPSAR
jgi:hypothetical protein